MNKFIFYILMLLLNMFLFINISFSKNIYQGVRIHTSEIKKIKIGFKKNDVINILGFPSILKSLNNEFIYMFCCKKDDSNLCKYLILILNFKNNKLINIKAYKKNFK